MLCEPSLLQRMQGIFDIVSAETILKMCETGNLEDALWQMKKKRCDLMDELHESGRKVDCLDFLIRGIEKELIQAKKR